MTGPRTAAWLALLVLLAPACTSDAPGEPAAAPTPPAQTVEPVPVEAPEGVYRLQGCEPRSLLPAATDACGAQVVAGLFSQLVVLDPADGSAVFGSEAPGAVAADVSSFDARRWQIELKPDWQFHDGSPVTASAFVDAWNFAARGTSAQAAAHLFEPILGFTDVNCPEPGCEPQADQMLGLGAVDEQTLSVVLREPDRLFPRRLAHLAFSPLPPGALEDPEAFEEAPVGNGPLRMEGSWEHNRQIALRPVDDHPAPAEAGVDVLLQTTPESVVGDLEEGLVDVATDVPLDLRGQVRDRYERVARAGGDYDFLVLPSHLPAYADDRLAEALSRAIDRRAVIDQVLGGAAEPARGVVPPAVLDGVDRCGERCRFAPEAARRLFQQVELPPDGLRFWLDADATHDPWARAVVDQWRRHLGLDETQLRIVTLPHSRWLSHVQDQRVTGPYPLGWDLEVASPTPYLRQLHAPGGLFNFDGYGGPGVGEAIDDALAADTAGAVAQDLAEVAQQVVDDMHHVPLWVRTHEAWYGDRVAALDLDLHGRVDLASVVLAE